MITPKELFHRICDTVDGAEVNASPRDTYMAILAAGATLCGVGLRQFETAEREQMLGDLPENVRRCLAAWAEAAAERHFQYSRFRNPYAH
jgi:hypothetical protein